MTTQTTNPTTLKSGIVYILTNEEMSGIKIGFTTGDLKTRLASLYTTGVPVPFEVYHSEIVDDCRAVETILHDLFSDERTNKNREFFHVDPEKVVMALKLCQYTSEKILPVEVDTTLDKYDAIAIENAKTQRPNININKLLTIDSVIYFARDELITAIVKENNKIEFRGKLTTISGAAKEIIGNVSVNGSLYWKYDGKTLNEIRNEIDE